MSIVFQQVIINKGNREDFNRKHDCVVQKEVRINRMNHEEAYFQNLSEIFRGMDLYARNMTLDDRGDVRQASLFSRA